jgi:Uma2 family endonuclease
MVKSPTKVEAWPIVLQLRPAINLTDDQLYEFCRLNADLRIELTAKGEMEIMPPTTGGTSKRNSELNLQLGTWAKQDGTGVVFESSAGFRLPNGAMRSPDAAWVKLSRLVGLPERDKEAFLPICPDFVIELRSRTDSLRALQAKMDEYIANGAQLGWLIDYQNRRVYVYRPQMPVERLENPAELSGDSVLPGFVLDMKGIWERGF